MAVPGMSGLVIRDNAAKIPKNKALLLDFRGIRLVMVLAKNNKKPRPSLLWKSFFTNV